MSEVVHPRAPAIAEKLDAARAMLAAHRGEMGQFVLDAAEGAPGATKRLVELRSQVSTAGSAVAELEEAYDLALRIDRQANAAATTQLRIEQLTECRMQFAAREKAMAAVLHAAADMAVAYGQFSEATLRTLATVPVGTVVPIMSIGAEGFAGPAFGPCTRLILAELYRLAPERSDGVGRFVVEFAKPSSEFARGKPEAINPGIDELVAADTAIVEELVKQIEKLDREAVRLALASERKDQAA